MVCQLRNVKAFTEAQIFDLNCRTTNISRTEPTYRLTTLGLFDGFKETFSA